MKKWLKLFGLFLSVSQVLTGECFVELKNKTFPYASTVGPTFETETAKVVFLYDRKLIRY